MKNGFLHLILDKKIHGFCNQRTLQQGVLLEHESVEWARIQCLWVTLQAASTQVKILIDEYKVQTLLEAFKMKRGNHRPNDNMPQYKVTAYIALNVFKTHWL